MAHASLTVTARLFVGLAVAVTMATNAYGQGKSATEAEKARRTTVTRLVENDRVDVARMVSLPGDKGNMKQRPDRVIYVVKGAKVRFHFPDGRTEDAVWKTGDTVYQKADNRQVENIDTKELEYISVHLK